MTYLDRYTAAVWKALRETHVPGDWWWWGLVGDCARWPVPPKHTHLQHGLAAQLLSVADSASVISLSLSLSPFVRLSLFLFSFPFSSSMLVYGICYTPVMRCLASASLLYRPDYCFKSNLTFNSVCPAEKERKRDKSNHTLSFVGKRSTNFDLQNWICWWFYTWNENKISYYISQKFLILNDCLACCIIDNRERFLHSPPIEIKYGNALKMMPSSVLKSLIWIGRLAVRRVTKRWQTNKKSTQTSSAWSAYLQRPWARDNAKIKNPPEIRHVDRRVRYYTKRLKKRWSGDFIATLLLSVPRSPKMVKMRETRKRK